jgi:hypothetical protein
MMDSQEMTLSQGMTEEVNKVEEAVVQQPAEAVLDDASQVETPESEEVERKVYETKAEILERIREIAQEE